MAIRKQQTNTNNNNAYTRIDADAVQALEDLWKASGRTKTHIASTAIKVYVVRELEALSLREAR